MGYNDLMQTVPITTVGVMEGHSAAQFNIYPNPSSDHIVVQFEGAGIEIIQIYNSLGQKVMERSVTQDQVIDVSGLLNDVYYVRVVGFIPSWSKRGRCRTFWRTTYWF